MADTNFTSQHAERITEAHTRLDGLDRRVIRLETAEAVSAERFRNIQKALEGIQTSISKVVWIIITAIGTGVMAFVINGGLNVTP